MGKLDEQLIQLINNEIEGKVVSKIPLLGIVTKIVESKITTIFILIIFVIMFFFNRDMKIKSERRRNIKQNQLNNN